LGSALFLVIIALAGFIGVSASMESSRNRDAAPVIGAIAALTAYSLLTFWRYAYLHWVHPTPGTGAQQQEPAQSGTAWRVVTFIAMILALGAARACSREIAQLLR
jgi:hypothetical protein